jgi:hypothetical protein
VTNVKKYVTLMKKRERLIQNRKKLIFYAEQGGKPQRLICLLFIGVSKEYNVNITTLFIKKNMTNTKQTPDLQCRMA